MEGYRADGDGQGVLVVYLALALIGLVEPRKPEQRTGAEESEMVGARS